MNSLQVFSDIKTKCFLLFFTICSILSAQEETVSLSAYDDYADIPREVAYLHLNKSTYIIGETLGFTAYILDKGNKKPSVLTSNLYVSVEDEAKNLIKQQLIEVNDGVASNTFEIDSLFSSGNYYVKAYTNWMRNFDEQNYFIASIKVMDQKINETDSSNLTNRMDAQFLPESGHLLDGVENTIGVIIKNNKGFGVPFAEGEVLDNKDRVLTTFKTNALGIGRFPLVANISNNYKVRLNASDKTERFTINSPIEKNGVILSVKPLKEKHYISITTNPSTLDLIKNQRYTLLLHNGQTYEIMDIYFTDDTTITKVIELGDRPGINILTLFNENNKPIAERLIFNHQGLTFLQSDTEPIVNRMKDSISIALRYKDINSSQPHNLSISVLPSDTESYNNHHNLISYNYLQPYLQSPVENAKYYFTDVSVKKKYELDNLLLTQGWSSYNWNTLFKGSPNINHDFEQGIIVKANMTSANLNENNKPNDLMYYFGEEGFLMAEANENNYIIKELFPEEDNTIKLSEITANNKLEPANLYLQFFPRQIPKLNHPKASVLNIMEQPDQMREQFENDNVIIKPQKGVTVLDEVIVKSNSLLEKKQRQNELSHGRSGRVSVVTDQDINTYVTLIDYLEFKAWNLAVKTSGPLNTTTGVVGTIGLSTATEPFLIQSLSFGVNYFLNDMLLHDFSRLEELFLTNVDYIEINRFGVSDGMRSPGGYVKIYTKNPTRALRDTKTAKAYEFPLTFSRQKKFYVPKYKYYDDEFFIKYGTIDWQPNLTLDTNGNINLKIAKPEVPVTLFIEGIANDGSFVLEEKHIRLN